jgi:hypothetical protein
MLPMLNEIGRNVFELAMRKANIAQQPDLSEVTQQFKTSMFLCPNYVNMRRAVVIGIDDDTPALDGR